MAEAQEISDDLDSASDEPEELERLLEATNIEELEAPEPPPDEAKRFFFSKKFWFLLAGGTLLILLAAAGAYFFLSSPKAEVHETVATPPPVETAKPTFNKVHTYVLEPFFLPLKVNGVETGNYISLVPNFILSNSALNEEIDKTLPAIRRSIYIILTRKSPRDYFLKKGKIEEQIKKEILTSVNPLLLTGTGAIDDVVFTQFIVK